MASLGSLVIELAASTARLQGDLGRGVAMMQSFANRARSVVGVLGVGAGGGLLGGIARQAIELGDELQKGALRAGVAASTFSELAAAAKQTDVDIGTLSKGLKNLQLAISEAATGNKKAADAFFELGLSVETLRNIPADRQLKAIADALKAVPNQTDRVRLGQDALNKAYQDLVPLLDEGSAGITKMVEAQKALGNTFSDKQIEALADADDAIKKLDASWSAFATTLTASVAPALTAVLDSLNERGLPTSQGGIDLLKGRLDQINPGSPDYQRLKAQYDASLEARRQTLSGFPRGHGGLTTEQQASVFETRQNILKEAEARKKALEQAKKDARELEQEVERARAAHANDRIADGGGLLSIDPQELEKTRGDYEELFGAIAQTADDGFAQVSDALKRSQHEFAAFADEAARGVYNAFESFFFDPFKDGLKGLAVGILDVIRHAIAAQAALSALKYLGSFGKGGTREGAGGVIGGLIGSLFGGYKAEGGPLQQGKWYIAGERGPEPVWGGGAGAFAMGYGNGGGVNFAPTYNIDARGATTDLIQALPAFLQARDQALKADIMDTLGRRDRMRR